MSLGNRLDKAFCSRFSPKTNGIVTIQIFNVLADGAARTTGNGKVQHATLGLACSEVMISTVSPVFSLVRNGIMTLLIRAATVL